jgi:hypothetical protein
MKIEVVTSYRVFSSAYINLPILNVNDIKDYFVKNDVLHYTLGDDKWEEIELSEKGEEEYEKSSEVKFYSAECHQTVMKLSKSI